MHTIENSNFPLTHRELFKRNRIGKKLLGQNFVEQGFTSHPSVSGESKFLFNSEITNQLVQQSLKRKQEQQTGAVSVPNNIGVITTRCKPKAQADDIKAKSIK